MNRSLVRVLLLAFAAVVSGCARLDRLVVGSKNFTESVLLAEIIAQGAQRLGIPVARKLNLGGTFVCHQAIISGQLDIYVEYTGTAYQAVLGLEGETDPARVRDITDSLYSERFDLEWGYPLGFNNTFAMLVRGEDARSLGLITVSDALPYLKDWTPGFGHEFLDRADGFRGFIRHYGAEFGGEPVAMDLGLMYRALAEGRVDLVAGNSTDGQIRALDLFHLEDDRRYFPPYEAIPVMRSDVAGRFPGLQGLLQSLGNSIDEVAMVEMNFRVDVEGEDFRAVARDFLDRILGDESSP